MKTRKWIFQRKHGGNNKFCAAQVYPSVKSGKLKIPDLMKNKNLFGCFFFLFDLKATDGGGERDKRTVRAGGMRRR